MRAPRLQRTPQGRIDSEQMGLAHVLIERLWTQSIGQRAVSAFAGPHLPPRPITSTPGGGTKLNKSAANFTLRFELEKVSCVI